MIELALSQYASTLRQVATAVEAIPDERMAQQFSGVVNHPAWTLGHLCVASAFVLQLLDEPAPELTAESQKQFGPGSTPTPDRTAYPAKSALLQQLSAIHDRASAAVRAKHASHFIRPAPEHLRRLAPTIGNLVFYLVAAHEPYHQGQLSQWLGASGLRAK